MSGVYPIILDGERTGEISVIRDGLFWRFEARNRMYPELIRLSVYGDGAEGYLGVMEPCDGELTLTKRLSRNAVSGFPRSISFASRRGEQFNSSEAALEASVGKEEFHNPAEANSVVDIPPQAHEISTLYPITSPPDENKPPPEIFAPPQPVQNSLQWMPCACPCSLFSGIEAKSIGSTIQGALVCETNEGVLLAVPCSIADALPNTNYMRFLGRSDIYGFEYDVFLV